MKKSVLSVLLCLVMALSLIPATAFAAGSYTAVTSGTATGSSTNDFTAVAKIWTDASGNYYVATASSTNHIVDNAFKQDVSDAVSDGKLLSADYVEGTLSLSGSETFSSTPAAFTGKNQSNIWVVYYMTADMLLDLQESSGKFVLPVFPHDGTGNALPSVTFPSAMIPTVTTYTLKYNLNGGTGSIADDIQSTSADSYTFTLSTATPTKDGYTFQGWATTAGADTPDVSGTVTVAKAAPTKTVYAVWAPASYDVTYYVDGVQVGTTESYNYGASVTVRDKFVKEGYTVTDWDRSDFIMPASNVEINATSTVNTYTVTYFVDGEQVGDVEIYEFGSPVTVRSTYVKEGYIVSAWNRADFTMPAADVEIYATSASNEVTPDPVDPVPSPAPAPVDPDVPATGDTMNMGIWITMMAVASVGMAAMFVYSKKKEDAE